MIVSKLVKGETPNWLKNHHAHSSSNSINKNLAEVVGVGLSPGGVRKGALLFGTNDRIINFIKPHENSYN